jgi:hypothetical protein
MADRYNGIADSDIADLSHDGADVADVARPSLPQTRDDWIDELFKSCLNNADGQKLLAS